MESNKILSNEFMREILIYGIGGLFPSLNNDDKLKILPYVIKLIFVISLLILRNLKDNEIITILRYNNYEELKYIILLLFPYFKNDSRDDLIYLDELFTKKKYKSNIKKQMPEYIFNNIQYNRHKRNPLNEQKFEFEFFEQNFYLLINTIYEITDKLFVNWFNITPINLNSPELKKLQFDTYNKIKKKKLTTIDILNDLNNPNVLIKKTKGITINMIYDTISIYFYENIKNIKWIIYDIVYVSEIKPLILLLSNIINLKPMYTDIPYDNLDEYELDIFNKTLTNAIKSIQYNETNRKIFRSICYFFDKYYKNIDEAINDGYIKITNVNIEDDDEKTLGNLHNIDKSIYSFPPKHVYEYIRKCMSKFKSTIYKVMLVDYNGDFADYRRDERVTLKNIYNFSKSLCHYNLNNKYNRFPKLWKTLTSEQKKIIINRLNDNDRKWFNISRYLKNIYGNINIDEKTKEIYYNIREELTQIIFNMMYELGCLSKIIFYENKEDNYIKQTIKNNLEKYSENIHFLTGNLYSKTNYFINENLPNDKELPSYYHSLNWISQIAFFHHYLNNKVILITGSTGVGKSTQIPKLALYALKFIDYKYNGKIVCTEPRQTPTENNAIRIANELGVPLNNNYYYIQFKHKKNQHVKNTNNIMLKLETDGTLLNELNNPYIKVLYNRQYIDENIYDIIIIDEAHEHNINMDIILTKLVYALNYNLDIKLFIISATMENDEPTYRRFYRVINDNLLKPYDTFISENKLDRINVDRRFDISTIDTTKYKITDYFVPNETYESIVKKLIGKKGNILIFKAGENEVNKLVIELNNIIPNNVIAIPWYSNMSDELKHFYTIFKNNEQVKINKLLSIDDIKNLENFEKGNNNYNQVIIIATNIAESSITISNLGYVIDDGKQKIAIYNYKTDTDELREVKITENNRIQRRGRVGRISDGEVYYLYPKNYITDEERNYYHISIENILFNIFDLLKDCDKMDDLYNITYNSEVFPYIGNNSNYDYQNDKLYHPKYIDKETIFDEKGKIYIIHPEEQYLIRNIEGDIVNITNDANENGITLFNNKIKSEKMHSFIKKLLYYNLIDTNYIKTCFGSIVRKMLINIPSIEMGTNTLKYIITILKSFIYNSSNEVIQIISFIFTIKEIKKITNKIKNFIELHRENSNSELIVLHHIFEKFLKNTQNLTNWCSKNYIIESQIIKWKDEYDKWKKYIDEIPNIFKNEPKYFIKKYKKNIIIPFLYGFPQQIVKKFKNSSLYINIFKPSFDVLRINKIRQHMIILIDYIKLQNYVLYLPQQSNIHGFFSLLTSISVDDIKLYLSKIYNNNNYINNLNKNKFNVSKNMKEHNEEYLQLKILYNEFIDNLIHDFL